ncbi:GNAT family N-acetyltransferase, partial [Fusobacterium necrophorum]|uniref:GNAT family N-acetyltransferase n=1 Tax=Fusobacterium necrophorum TaxID=859 RepID=UPI0030A82018
IGGSLFHIWNRRREYLAWLCYFLNSIDCQEIIKIAVNKEHRRRGLATKLLEAEKRRPILLEVRESNLEAQEFYKRHGFEEIYVRKQYYRDNGENAIILEKK